MSLTFAPIHTDEQIALAAKLADEIWNEHYSVLLSKQQIDYMLERFQSPDAIEEQIRRKDYSYYFMESGGEPIGYLAVKPEDGKLFLSKFYLLKAHRGKGFASRAIEFLEMLCGEGGLEAIWLTVNRDNQGSIAVYEKKGFRTVRTQVADIGNGFVMDDYVMEKAVANASPKAR
ncbi:GNAT family N-acetyltransferase [Cohnella sp. AR92]|uniref:GNAT family N-acetyltransferase n=1 Tax=Cohnella sp. AR92 TaxID=648716 RepID=UPI000F8CACCD|nr:GNAT family N-acetyltransferase [Cohnella sp. AR92]RUS48581.1 GNAT family N-acetyltransferase [Cohnella sp. AR92]